MSPPEIEAPIGWRVCLLPASARPADREFKPKSRFTIHVTREEAEAEKQRQRAHFGELAAICVEPVFPPRAKRDTDRKAMQESLTAAGWPIQMRPPRPGMPVKKARRR